MRSIVAQPMHTSAFVLLADVHTSPAVPVGHYAIASVALDFPPTGITFYDLLAQNYTVKASENNAVAAMQANRRC